uniref:Filamin-A n=1 Tax=Panagrellus redivivus TaxID=6233 RepID=A0A7E4VTY2_PANRE
MSCVRTNDKVMKILYNPPVAGTYQINVNFDEKIVPSCPHFVECREPEVNVLSRNSWSGSTGQSKTVVRDDYIHQVATPQTDLPQSPLKVQSPAPQSPKSQRSSVVSPVSPRSPNESSRRRAELDLFVPNSESSQLTSVVVDPRGNQLTSAVANVGKGYHSIQFKVTERGRYTAHVYQNNHEIFGSPFSFIAGAKKHGNAENIQITGTGLEFAQAGQPQSFMIHTAEAGPGVVNVVIDGPEKPLTKLKDLRDGRVFVEYTANTHGHYFITVLFNGVSVRTTPYCVYVSPAKPSKSKKQNGSTSKVVTPTSPAADQSTQQTVSTPKSATNMAKLSGRGLTRGTTGSITEFDILPLYQGDMIYAIEVHGPSKVKLSTETTSNGIRVKFVPLAPGDYNITVKNNGVNVDESPCRCKVDGSNLGGSGINESTVIYARYISHSSTTVTKYEKKAQPIEYIDQEVVQKTRAGSSAKNIVIDGQGMTQFAPGKPAMFKIFNIGCETLFVGVVTAHGPCQQCSVSNCGDGSFLVTYVINDRTPGFVYIRYGNEDVPGSPFKTLPASR